MVSKRGSGPVKRDKIRVKCKFRRFEQDKWMKGLGESESRERANEALGVMSHIGVDLTRWGVGRLGIGVMSKVCSRLGFNGMNCCCTDVTRN